tara:strand:+ start:1504 stop:1773 length:270 start_codon:yes stop_codon:yes gene_type:complete
MSFVYASLDNQTPYLHTEFDYDTDAVIDGYLRNKYQHSSVNEKKIDDYKINKNTIMDNVLRYNYQRFVNGQLTLAIISLIMYNYNMMTN